MRRFIPFLAIFLILFSFLSLSCSQEPATPGKRDISVFSWEPVTGSAVIPWKGNASAIAEDTGRLYIYYMAGEGTEVPGVGQKIGDSALVVFPDGKTMLIDACSEPYCETLVANLKRLGVSRIDYMVFTHGHSDHYACFTCGDGLCNNFEIGQVYYDGTINAGNTKIINKCQSYGIPYSILKRGDALSIGGVSIEILNPSPDVVGTEVSVEADQNNTSITMKFTYGDISALFCGDLYKAGMQALVDIAAIREKLDADIVRMPHHGHSETSILQSFANAVSPVIAVASSGVPVNTSVYSMWKSAGATILNDYTMGYIILSTDGKTIYSDTSRSRQTTYYDQFDKIETPAPAFVPEPDTSVYYTVSTVDELIAAIGENRPYIKLGADLDISGYTKESPLTLNMTGKVLNLDGHTVSGCCGGPKIVSAKESDNDIETNLVFNGNNFTIKNGCFLLQDNAGGFAFRINSLSSTKPNLNPNVVLEALTISNGGVNINGCTATVRGCTFIQPWTCTKNRPPLILSYAKCTLQSGTYRYEGANGGNKDSIYNRFLRMYDTDLTIGNDVRYKGTLWYSVSTSRLNLDRTLL